MKPKLLLHVCCGPCATQSIVEAKEQYEVIMFFSDSNIYPKEEYLLRLENAKKLAEIYKVKFVEDEYTHDLWLEQVKGLEKEQEGGKRCSACFEFNFKRTIDYARNHNITFFSTTLTISPYKKSKTLFETAKNIISSTDTKIKVEFVEFDFKKKDGYKKSIELSKKFGLYRQNYCGCEFSLRD